MKITKLPNGGELREYDGDKLWYLDGKLHREDGPAIETYYGTKYWCIYDKYIPCTTQKQFEKLMKLKAFW